MTLNTHMSMMIAERKIIAKRMSSPEVYPTREEVIEGWYRFWSKTQVNFFLRDKYGRNILDKDGNCIAIRTNIPRVLPDKPQIEFANERS